MRLGSGAQWVAFVIWCCRIASAQPPEVLRVGTPVDRGIRPKEIHLYRIHADAGQVFHLTARQKGADIVLALNRPDGAELGRSDLPNGGSGLETIAVRTPVTGDYVVSIKGDGPWPEGSRYVLT